MAYVKFKTMRFSTTSNKDYAYEVVDKLKEAFTQLSINATVKKFENLVNLTDLQVLTNNNMPSWIADNASSNINIKFSSLRNSPSNNAGRYCIACIYWEIGEIRYAYFIGNAYTSSINSYLGDTLTQNLNVEGATDIQNSNNNILGTTACGGDYSYCHLGITNTPDFFTIAKTEKSFHMYIKGKEYDSYNKYVGQNIFNYEDSIINPRFNKATKFPTNNNLEKDLIATSFGVEIQNMINKAVGDILTEQFYAFDIYYGIENGTIINTIDEAYYIPHVNVKMGELLNIGEETYLSIETFKDKGFGNNKIKIYVRVN